jgi:hypothetical protein
MSSSLCYQGCWQTWPWGVILAGLQRAEACMQDILIVDMVSTPRYPGV